MSKDIDADSTKRELITWLSIETREEIINVIKEINSFDEDIYPHGLNVSGSKEDLLKQLSSCRLLTKDVLWAAIDEVFDDADDEYEFDEDDEDDTTEDDNDDEADIMYEYQLKTLEKDFKFNKEESAKNLDASQSHCIKEMENAFLSSKKRQYLYVATGGGKTLIAVDFINKNYTLKGKRVLWLTNSPFLVYQASKTFIQRYGNIKKIAYWGSENDKKRHIYKHKIESYRKWNNNAEPLILFSTWGTLASENSLRGENGKALRDFSPDIIVIDEAHWGKGGSIEKKVYEKLFNKAWDGVPILGLSATPKVRMAGYAKWDKKHLGNLSFSSLIGSRLARPEPIEIRLKTEVDYEFDSKNRIKYDATELQKRNIEIVQAYKQRKSDLGKTLVVCANKEHANSLFESFKKESVVVIHSGVTNPTVKLQEFIDNKYLIAIVVGMAKEGVDIPDLKTVMLAKPITSEIEFAQFVGRASRRFYKDTEGNLKEKSFFYIVDFYDNLKDKSKQSVLYHFKDYFRGAADKEIDSEMNSSGPRRSEYKTIKDRKLNVESFSEHEVNLEPEFRTIKFNHESDEIEKSELNDIRINTKQTFGIEFEIAATNEPGAPDPEKSSDWLLVANRLRLELVKLFTDQYVAKDVKPKNSDVKNIDYKKWNVVYDGSCGWEIVTPILKGESGFIVILKFLTSLQVSGILSELKLHVDYSTGTHINLGWDFTSPKVVQNLLLFMRQFEPSFQTLVSPSRVIGGDNSPAQYCAPVRTRFSEKEILDLNTKEKIKTLFSDHEERYHSVNLTKYSKPVQVLEIRLHNGTLEAHKILLWVSIWMNLLPVISRGEFTKTPSGNDKKRTLPTADDNSDIIHVLRTFANLTAEQEKSYLQLIAKRRSIVFEQNNYWKKELLDHEKVVEYFQKKSAQLFNT